MAVPNLGYHNRKTSRPDNGRTKKDRAEYRRRSAELSVMWRDDPAIRQRIDAYRTEWARNLNLASFPAFSEWEG